ncbi:MAG: trypsin-like peptidase domain-containing protein, partial [Clostridia bacterium]|nr:trypsin-like peptidase domain-containing protein [Clostridia bacterium]
MKTTTKILAIALTLFILALSLTSCFLYDTASGISNSNKGDTTINVSDVNNHQINISSTKGESEIAASKALMSSVSIVTDFSLGSGVIFKMSEDKGTAYILTNYHVVYNPDTDRASGSVKVYLYGMESYREASADENRQYDYTINAEFVGGTEKYDLAVLKVVGSEVLMRSNAVACTFADSDKVAVLQTAIAVGNAVGAGISVTMGKINVTSEYINLLASDNRTTIQIRVMRTDAAVNSGNSGGGLFNEKGDLIGIVNAKDANSSVDNIGFAIPSNVARYIADNILYYCDGTSEQSAYKCMLGIQVTPIALYTEYDTETGLLTRKETIEILSVVEGGAAENVLKAGDILNSITIDGKTYPITRLYHVVDAMLNARASSTVVVNLTRGSQALDLAISLSSKNIVNADAS